jgi:hypothetical protein
VAVMVAGVPPFVPALTTNPELVTIAVAMVSEFHVTTLVTSCVLLSLNFMVAVICWLVPSARFGFAGVMVNVVGLTLFMVKVEVDAFTDPKNGRDVRCPGGKTCGQPGICAEVLDGCSRGIGGVPLD